MKRKAKFQGFVPYSVDKPIKTAVQKLEKSSLDVIQGFCELAEEGYKFSIVYEDDREAFSASLYQNDSRGDNAGLYLAARHRDAETAMKLLWVLHYDAFNEKWPDPNSNADQYDW